MNDENIAYDTGYERGLRDGKVVGKRQLLQELTLEIGELYKPFEGEELIKGEHSSLDKVTELLNKKIRVACA